MIEYLAAQGKRERGMRIAVFDEIEQRFTERVHQAVWCTLATVDTEGRPRTRIVHTIWEGATGYAVTRRGSPKLRDIAANPHVSLAYTTDIGRPVYAECRAVGTDDGDSRRHVWDLFGSAPAPLGYDVSTIFKSADDPEYIVLRFDAERIAVEDATGQGERRLVWRATR